jgi:DNA-binding response OmpR family regulator
VIDFISTSDVSEGMSAKAESAEMTNVLEKGMHMFLTKPLNMSYLTEILLAISSEKLENNGDSVLFNIIKKLKTLLPQAFLS